MNIIFERSSLKFRLIIIKIRLWKPSTFLLIKGWLHKSAITRFRRLLFPQKDIPNRKNHVRFAQINTTIRNGIRNEMAKKKYPARNKYQLNYSLNFSTVKNDFLEQFIFSLVFFRCSTRHSSHGFLTEKKNNAKTFEDYLEVIQKSIF